MHLNQLLFYSLLLVTCLALLSIGLAGSESSKRGQRRVFEKFEEVLDEDETDQYISEHETESRLEPDQPDSPEENVNSAAWNEGEEGSDKDEREDSGAEDHEHTDGFPWSEGVDTDIEDTGPKSYSDPNGPLEEPSVYRNDAYLGEMLMVTGICVYLICFLIGRARGERMVTAWFESNADLLYDNFSLVGIKDTEHKFMKEREDVFRLWCSGRVGCEGMMVEIALDKRHDLLSRLATVIKSVPDKITITAMLPIEETEHVVCALGSKKQLSRMLKEYEDLIFFANSKVPYDKCGFTQGVLVTACESQEAITSIISTQIAKIIEANIDCFESLHISDQYIGTKADNDPDVVTEPQKPTARIILKLIVPTKRKSLGATSSEMTRMLPMTQLVMMLIDRIRKLKLSKEVRLKTQKNRAKFQEGLDKKKNTQRMEAAQKKKEEKSRAAHDLLMQETDPNKAKKMEERDRKKQLKKSGVQAKIVKVK